MQTKSKVGPFEKRIHEIDLIRGFLIIIVVLDHVCWCLKYYGNIWFGENHWLYQAFNWYWTSTARSIIQPVALMLFCFISGVSCAFSKNNWKRAIQMLVFWAIIVVASNIIQAILNSNGNEAIIRVDFNIIGVLAFSTLIYCFMQKRSWRILLAAILIGFLLSTYFIPGLREELFTLCGGRVGERIGGVINIPNFYLIPFWEYPVQADYVPLLPYLMFFLLGALFSYFTYKQNKQSLFPKRGEWERPICFIGRHTLIIYLSHFIVIRGIFIIINLIINHQFA